VPDEHGFRRPRSGFTVRSERVERQAGLRH
jgi:hypothetical protein